MIKQDLHDILDSVNFVDKIIFGRLHYNKAVSAYHDYKQFYNDCAAEVVRFCEGHDISYHIKNGTMT